jgi:hypothetical protein
MTVLRAFRKRPPFPIPTPSLPGLLCPPRSYVRAILPDGRLLWAPCYAWAPGPQALVTTGDGSYTTLYGESWMLQMCPDGTWRLYHRRNLARLEHVAWDVTPPAASETARHPTLAFDQAARPAMAWEDASGITLREFDEVAGVYAFVGPFPGRDPVLLADATVNYHVGGSDVALFYLSDDRERLMYRVQNDNYLVEHEHHDFGMPVVVDASDIGGYRFQLKYSDLNGVVIPESGSFRALVSDVYPVHVRSLATGSVHALEDGAYELVTITTTPARDALTGAVASLGDGEFRFVIIQRESDDALIGSVASLGDGEFRFVIIQRESDDALVGSVASLEDGLMRLAVFRRDPAPDGMTGAVGSLEDGAYAAA